MEPDCLVLSFVIYQASEAFLNGMEFSVLNIASVPYLAEALEHEPSVGSKYAVPGAAGYPVLLFGSVHVEQDRVVLDSSGPCLAEGALLLFS